MLYAERFENIRTNYEIDMTTDPKLLTSERGWYFQKLFCFFDPIHILFFRFGCIESLL